MKTCSLLFELGFIRTLFMNISLVDCYYISFICNYSINSFYLEQTSWLHKYEGLIMKAELCFPTSYTSKALDVY